MICGSKSSIKLLFAGDFIPPADCENVFSKELTNMLEDKDFSFVNLECPLTKSTNKIIKAGKCFKVSPESIQKIINGKFDAVNLSNNHIRDFGDQGILDTLETCKGQGILTVGAGKNIENAAKPLRVEIKGKKIAFLNYSEREFNAATENQGGANPFDLLSAYYDIRNEKAANDYVIVIYHGGLEYQQFPTHGMVKSFKFMIDVGADCIVSHHTHRYSGVITYKNKPVLFGLGNLLSPTKRKLNNDALIGLLSKIIINDNSIKYELFPVKMKSSFNFVKILTGEKRQRVLQNLNEISKAVSDETVFNNYWKQAHNKESKRIIRMIKSDSLTEYRLRKYISKLFSGKLSRQKLLTLLTFTRCDAHKERLISILESVYEKKCNKTC